MQRYLPTIKQLQYLVALHEHGHFSRAAEACYITQSTLSAGIKELESLIGATIVERTKRVVRFTPLGEALVAKAHHVLRAAEDMVDIAQGSAQPLTGSLRMAVIPTIAPFLLPTLLPRLRHDYPQLDIQLREEMSGQACRALHNGQVDCVLLALPYACGTADHMALGQDALMVAAPRVLADALPARIPADALEEHALLMLADGHCLADHALAACNNPAIRAHALMIGSSLHTLVQMVHNGLGLTMVPALAVNAGLLQGTDIVTRPLAADNASRTIALIWRPHSPREADFRALGDVIRKTLALT